MEWLVEIRKSLHLSQVEVADAAGISQSHYAAIESGVRNPSVGTAKNIAKVLGFSWTRFYDAAAVETEVSPAEEIA
jgi:transcriptional regulator with XRE-family HTH domain